MSSMLFPAATEGHRAPQGYSATLEGIHVSPPAPPERVLEKTLVQESRNGWACSSHIPHPVGPAFLATPAYTDAISPF